MVEHELAKIAEVVASEYVASQTPSVIKNNVEELLHQHHHEDRVDEKLCKMIIDATLDNRMCESPLASLGEFYTSWFLFHTALGAQK
jgi:hypothetical protein